MSRQYNITQHNIGGCEYERVVGAQKGDAGVVCGTSWGLGTVTDSVRIAMDEIDM